MKRRLAIIVPVIVALIALGAVLALRPAAPAHADARGGGWMALFPFNPPPVDPSFCGFWIDPTVLADKEYSKVVATLPDGTTVQQITGELKVSLTNRSTGKTIDYNISGPATLTTHPDGSTFLVSGGTGIQFFAPPADTAFGIPAVAYIQGHYTESVDGSGNITGFTLDGTATDVCAALS